MMKFKKYIWLAICSTVLLVAGCGGAGDSKKISSIDAGKVLNAQEITTSFNDSQRTRIETTKGVFTVNGVVSVFKDKTATVDAYDNGNSYLCIESKSSCPAILGN